MSRTAPSQSKAAETSFEVGVTSVTHDVRDAFARIIEFRSQGSRAVSALCEAFGIHRKLAWQVSKVAYSDDPFVAALHVPTGKSLAAWLDAARGAGVPGALVNAAERAAERFQALADEHSTSRAEFEMLLESCSNGADPDAHVKWRQQSFAGNSFVWGAHCKVLLALMVLQPSDEVPRHFHCAQVRGLIGYRQIRPGVRWVVNQAVVSTEGKDATPGIRRVPLDPDAARVHDSVPVLPAYCSSPMPRLSRRSVPGGMVVDEFVSTAVGQAGERTLVTGEVARNIGPAHATPGNAVAHFGTGVRIPAELLHFDLFCHRRLFGDGPVQRDLRVFGDLASPFASDDADAIPVPERIATLGRGVSLAQTPDIPAYTDLASGVFASLGADPADYDLFRVRMPFPPMPVSVMVRHVLPPAPPDAAA